MSDGTFVLPKKLNDAVPFEHLERIARGYIGTDVSFTDLQDDNKATLKGTTTEADGSVTLIIAMLHRKRRYTDSPWVLHHEGHIGLSLSPRMVVRITKIRPNEFYISLRNACFIKLGR